MCAYTIQCAGIVVARVRMSKMTGPAYGAAISLRAFAECCNKENGGNLIDKLKGIIVDWSSEHLSTGPLPPTFL